MQSALVELQSALVELQQQTRVTFENKYLFTKSFDKNTIKYYLDEITYRQCLSHLEQQASARPDLEDLHDLQDLEDLDDIEDLQDLWCLAGGDAEAAVFPAVVVAVDRVETDGVGGLVHEGAVPDGQQVITQAWVFLGWGTHRDPSINPSDNHSIR